MRIRTRMAVVAAAVAVPQLLGLAWWDGHSRHVAAEAVLTGMLDRVVGQPDGATRCLADPSAWRAGLRLAPGPPHDRREPPPGPPPPRPGGGPTAPEVRTYSDGDTLAALGLSPSALVTGQVVAVPYGLGDADVSVAVRTGWGGPCEVVAVRWSTVPGFLGSVLPATPVWIAPILLVATVMWLAVGPTVRRVRRLTAAVQRGDDASVALGGDDELAELSRAFDARAAALRDEARTRLQREEALRAFVADTAHDVRVPLTVLRGHLAALESGPDAAVLAQAIAEAHYLGALLDNLAARARMQAASELSTVDLGTMVARVCARHEPLARRRGISLDHGVPEQPVEVRADVTLVEQALSNLVYNAVRYHREEGHVAVTLDTTTHGFVLAVVDDGPGVPDAELQRLTERGFRGSQARARDGLGDGLGLAIVAEVAARHGWAFTLDHREGGGLEATLAGS